MTDQDKPKQEVAEPPAKKAKVEDDRPKETSQKVISQHLFYPQAGTTPRQTYSDWDPSRLTVAKDLRPCAAKAGGGDMAFIGYQFSDAQKDFLVQMPNGMWSAGVRTWDGGRTTMLISAGRDWRDKPQVMEFFGMMAAFRERLITIILERGWAGPKATRAMVEAMFEPFFAEREVPLKGETYPPSLSGNVDARTELFELVREDPPMYRALAPADAAQAGPVTPIVHFPWLFRRTGQKIKFSVRVNVRQARIFRNSAATSSFSGYAVQD